jgi:hypothetical protein
MQAAELPPIGIREISKYAIMPQCLLADLDEDIGLYNFIPE